MENFLEGYRKYVRCKNLVANSRTDEETCNWWHLSPVTLAKTRVERMIKKSGRVGGLYKDGIDIEHGNLKSRIRSILLGNNHAQVQRCDIQM